MNEPETTSFFDDFFSPDAEGVRIAEGPAPGQLTVSYIEDHYVHGIIIEGESYFDFVRDNALRWQHSRLEYLSQENALLKERVAALLQTIYGTSSEKAPSEVESPPTQEPHIETDAPNVIVFPKERRPQNAGRKPLPDHLPREDKTYEAAACPCCSGSALHVIGDEETEQLSVIPAQFKVIRHIRRKYRCRQCEKVFTAQGPKHLIEKSSYASPEFLAYVACSKYQFGLPFYRQEAIFNQAGLPFNRTTLANLMMGCADKLSALYEILHQELLGQDVIHADETNIQVLKEPGRKPETKSWLWLYRSREGIQNQIVLFDYQQTRGGEHPRRFFDVDGKQVFSGYLHVDGYAGYNNLTNMTRVGCMVHVRRKFADVVKSLPTNACNSPAHQALALIGKLYGVERKIKGLPDRERYKC